MILFRRYVSLGNLLDAEGGATGGPSMGAQDPGDVFILMHSASGLRVRLQWEKQGFCSKLRPLTHPTTLGKLLNLSKLQFPCFIKQR